MGLFFSSVGPQNVLSDGKPLPLREHLREMKTSTLRSAKNFAVVGGMFTCVECSVESVRALF